MTHGRESGPRPETLAAIEAALGKSLSPVEPIRVPRVVAPVAAAAALVAGVVALFAGRAGVGVSLGAAAVGVAMVFAVAALAVRVGLPASGVTREALVAAVVGALAVAFGVAALFAPITVDVSGRGAPEWACVAMTIGFAALPAIVAAVQLRRLYLWSWRRVVALAFFAVGFGGSVVAEIVCRSGEASHIVLTHFAGIGVVAAVGAWLGGRRR